MAQTAGNITHLV